MSSCMCNKGILFIGFSGCRSDKSCIFVCVSTLIDDLQNNIFFSGLGPVMLRHQFMWQILLVGQHFL